MTITEQPGYTLIMMGVYPGCYSVANNSKIF